VRGRGAHCISLGVQTPLLDIVEARAQRVDMIALSFSVAMNPRQALDGLAELHTRLVAAELWAGGSNPRSSAGARLCAGV
jgi:hypothetical protein